MLGCQIYVKEILHPAALPERDALQEGDVVMRINQLSTDNMSLKEARKLLEAAKERVHLLVRRQPGARVPAAAAAEYQGKGKGEDIHVYSVIVASCRK